MALVVTFLLILPTYRPLQVDTQQKEALSKNLKIICFTTSAQTWRIETVEIQVQDDVTNLYPSILIYKAIDVILQQLIEGSRKIKKLTLIDIQQLIGPCVSHCYFLWNNVIWNLINPRPINYSIMIVL